LTLLIVVSSFEAILRSRPFDILTAPATYFALTHQLHIDESGPFDRTSASRNSPLCHKLQTQKSGVFRASRISPIELPLLPVSKQQRAIA